MRMTKMGTVYQLSFLPRFFPVNCYLVEEDDELTLIDAALPYSTKGILEAGKKIRKPITNIILTHAHDDHVGALDALKAAMPSAKVSISSREARLLTGDKTLLDHEKGYPIKGGVPKNSKTKPRLLLEEGDRVGSLKVIFTPGHTPGSISLIDVRNNALIAGDAFQTRGGIAVFGTFKLLFPFPAIATWNKTAALESAKKLQNFSPGFLAVRHGKMIKQPMGKINKAIQEAEKKITKKYIQ